MPLPEDLENNLGSYTYRGEETERLKECLFCKNCGVRVMHLNRDESGSLKGNVSIKGGLVEGLDWTGGIHIFTRSAVVPIPEGAKSFEAAPT